MFQGGNSPPAKFKVANQQENSATEFAPTPVYKSQSKISNDANRTSGSQDAIQHSESNTFQQTQILQYWILVITSIITTVALICYTIYTGLTLRQIRRQADNATNQLKEMQNQREEMKRQAAHAGDQVTKMQETLEAMRQQGKTLHTQTGAMFAQARIMQSSLSETRNLVKQNGEAVQAMQGQLGIMEVQAKTMDASLKFGLRAYVGIHSIKFKAHAKRVFIEIENVGRRPAHHISVSAQMEIQIPMNPEREGSKESVLAELTRPRLLEQRLESPDLPIAGGVLINLVPIIKDFGRTKLYPGNLRILIMIRLNEVISDGDFSLITEGVAILRVKGSIRYNDGFNSGQESAFAFRYFLADDLWILDPILPPTGFEVDNASGEQPEN